MKMKMHPPVSSSHSSTRTVPLPPRSDARGGTWVHRTNYKGRVIRSSKATYCLDKDLDGLEVIWTQYSTAIHYSATCCFNFGRRRVFVGVSDLIREHDGVWNLFLVDEREGANDGHYFYKFALVPSGLHRFGKNSCVRDRGWEWICSTTTDAVKAGRHPLANLLTPNYDGDKHADSSDDAVKYHVHVGIRMDTLVA